MERFTMIALTNAKPGRDAEFLAWYRDIHLAEVLSVPGVITAQLGAVVDIPAAGKAAYGYTGLYTIEAENPATVFEEMMRRYVAGEMTACDAMDPASYNNVFACDPVIIKSA
jgi:hypothetical protein